MSVEKKKPILCQGVRADLVSSRDDYVALVRERIASLVAFVNGRVFDRYSQTPHWVNVGRAPERDSAAVTILFSDLYGNTIDSTDNSGNDKRGRHIHVLEMAGGLEGKTPIDVEKACRDFESWFNTATISQGAVIKMHATALIEGTPADERFRLSMPMGSLSTSATYPALCQGKRVDRVAAKEQYASSIRKSILAIAAWLDGRVFSGTFYRRQIGRDRKVTFEPFLMEKARLQFWHVPGDAATSTNVELPSSAPLFELELEGGHEGGPPIDTDTAYQKFEDWFATASIPPQSVVAMQCFALVKVTIEDEVIATTGIPMGPPNSYRDSDVP
jgi:hypothetical protein